jgi:Flp pilus assembly protein TadG
MMARLAGIRRPHRGRDQRGVVAVEFALVMPILLLLVFGIIEFGYMLNRDTIVNNASRDGAREASLSGTCTTICAAVKADMSQQGIPVPTNCVASTAADTGTTTIRISCVKPDTTACAANSTNYSTVAISGSTTTVNVTYKHTLITPFISTILGDVVTLQQSTQMRVE